jgi:hypothetical protein
MGSGEAKSTDFFFVSSSISMDNLLWNMDTKIVEFGRVHNSIISILWTEPSLGTMGTLSELWAFSELPTLL